MPPPPTGLASGDIGAALKAGAIAAATAVAFNVAGSLTSGLPVANIAAHAAIGCASAVASGGKCGPGALSTGVSAFSGHVLPDFGFEGNLVARSVVGGLSSVAGGGKFGNGAVTAAFGYLSNEFSHLWYGYDAHYSIESYFEGQDPRFQGKVQLGRMRADLVFFDDAAMTIDVFEIKADTLFSRLFGSGAAQLIAYADRLSERYPGYTVNVASAERISQYYPVGTQILSNTVPGRSYVLNENVGDNGMIYYKNYGRDPIGEAVLRGLKFPWGGVVPSWPGRMPLYP